LKDLGLDILDIDWQVDFDDAHKISGEPVTVCGNINPVTIQDATEEDLGDMVRKLALKEEGRRFICSGGCEITVNTPPRNLLAMKKSLYPIP